MSEKKYNDLTVKATDSGWKKQFYTVYDNADNEEIGFILCQDSWDNYCFEPTENGLFGTSDLLDIIDFISNHAGKESK